MLTLGRYQGQRIVIGEGANRVVIHVRAIESGSPRKVRLAIECDRSITIWRGELLDRERAQAESTTGTEEAPAG
jgi:sRNA-binding carbon storage regulator CsrA